MIFEQFSRLQLFNKIYYINQYANLILYVHITSAYLNLLIVNYELRHLEFAWVYIFSTVKSSYQNKVKMWWWLNLITVKSYTVHRLTINGLQLQH